MSKKRKSNRSVIVYSDATVADYPVESSVSAMSSMPATTATTAFRPEKSILALQA